MKRKELRNLSLSLSLALSRLSLCKFLSMTLHIRKGTGHIMRLYYTDSFWPFLESRFEELISVSFPESTTSGVVRTK